MAGIWEEHEDAAAGILRTLAILTTRANATVRPLHDRMPVIVPEAAWRVWISHAAEDQDQVAALLVPAPNDLLIAHPVSRRVNSPAFDDPACLEPVEDERTGQINLFG